MCCCETYFSYKPRTTFYDWNKSSFGKIGNKDFWMHAYDVLRRPWRPPSVPGVNPYDTVNVYHINMIKLLLLPQM